MPSSLSSYKLKVNSSVLIGIGKWTTSGRGRTGRAHEHLAYSLGHVLNDLCAAMWFSYTLLFFQSVVGMVAGVAGGMMLLGQVIDALATPVVGVLADRHGTKKAWHLAGCLIVMASFPLLFVRCYACDMLDPDTRQILLPVYYGCLIVLFQIGWAIAQISHLAMIPEISDDLKVRSNLTSLRYIASVASSLVVYVVTWLVLRSSYSESIGPNDGYKFRNIALIISLVGVLAMMYFQYFFKLNQKEKPKPPHPKETTPSSKNVSSYALEAVNHTGNNEIQPVINGKPTVKGDHAIANGGHNLKKAPHTVNGAGHAGTGKPRTSSIINEQGKEVVRTARSRLIYYLRMPLLYETSMLYVFSRLYWALSLIYVPLFLEERLSVNPTAGSQLVASVPLVVFVSSMIFTVFMRSKILNFGNYIAYLVGSIISLISCLWIALAINHNADVMQIYFVAALIGAGSSITLVSSLCVTADLIGPNSNHGASIYSIVTFADKLVTGFAVVAIENYKCKNAVDCPQYYRGVLTYACGGSAILGILSLMVAHRGLQHKIETHL
ncbi:major facilitator superfamily domain-containing protein 12-like isoform X2 [Anticarsia gemmatalis]|uniref:major facilitator superfamily domain-containing protein 12-like isoform X2 n=1 Tax=Anticarsia gemmatalis TaxID=129554 RepID=UPI003F764903